MGFGNTRAMFWEDVALAAPLGRLCFDALVIGNNMDMAVGVMHISMHMAAYATYMPHRRADIIRLSRFGKIAGTCTTANSSNCFKDKSATSHKLFCTMARKSRWRFARTREESSTWTRCLLL